MIAFRALKERYTSTRALPPPPNSFEAAKLGSLPYTLRQLAIIEISKLKSKCAYSMIKMGLVQNEKIIPQHSNYIHVINENNLNIIFFLF